ncbi:MAG: right-handed parallel beta-helix repeat-containing protein, partial [Sedimentisphaerales bacterium]|nr:right-handed parallel beta-helix repeat-containing protein [Sedimentisphaerales bacterium]
MKKTLVLAIVAGVLSAVANSGGGSIYYVPTSTTTVDGDTFCGGAACTSADTIIIRGGARGGLKFQDFDGAGSYITITNENTNPNSKVVIDGMSGYGCLSISNCKYIDLRGNNDAGLEYGIKVINDNTSQTPGSVWVYGESDHIKIGYLEITCEGSTVITGNGIFVSDSGPDKTWTYDTFDIHHNYIHDTRYAGMYLGMNTPFDSDNPHVANFSVHDNLLEDLGAYGITLKGVRSTSGKNLIYNNTIQGSSGGQSTGFVTAAGNLVTFGIGGADYYGTNGVDIYNNRIDKTLGNGIHVGVENQNVYDNVICGCGSCNEDNYGHGIMTWWHAKNAHIYDNIIIQPKRYGIYAVATTQSALMSRNLIGDAGVGEWGEKELRDVIESSGADVNIYHADVADFGFKVWSDDGDYSNDDFSPGILVETPVTSTTINAAIASAQPGDCVIIPDGVYNGMGQIKVPSNVDGTKANPITLKSATAGGVTFTGNSASPLIFVQGDWWIIRDFKFIDVSEVGNANTHGINTRYATGTRVTNNYFEGFGVLTDTNKNSWPVWIGHFGKGNYSRVDHNTFIENEAMGVVISSTASHCQVDHNYFKDTLKDGSNGFSAIHVGGSDKIDLYTTVEYNVFENMSADP